MRGIFHFTQLKEKYKREKGENREKKREKEENSKEKIIQEAGHIFHSQPRYFSNLFQWF